MSDATSFQVLTCVSHYLNREKDLLSEVIKVQRMFIDIVSFIRIELALEQKSLAMHIHVYEPCKWSFCLRGKTTLYTLLNYYIQLVKHMNKSCELYLSLLEDMIEHQFSLDYTIICGLLERFRDMAASRILPMLKKMVEDHAFFLNLNADAREAMFMHYDEKSKKAMDLLTCLLESYMSVESVYAPMKTNLEAYELYAALQLGCK